MFSSRRFGAQASSKTASSLHLNLGVGLKNLQSFCAIMVGSERFLCVQARV